MRILFCVAPTDMKTPFLQQPVEALYTATILQQRGHTVALLDLRVKPLSNEAIAAHAPDLVFLVTQTYDLSQCYALTLNGPQLTLGQLRAALPGTPVIATGMHGSIETDITARSLAVDAVLPGELEAAVPWLVDALARDPHLLSRPLPLADIPTLADPATLPVPNYQLIDPSAYRGEVLDLHTKQLQYGSAGLIFANRGCPYACAYCFVWFGKKIRYRPVPLVIEEIRQQMEFGIRHFFFLDYTFTIDKTWVRQFCRALKAADLEVGWVCQTRCELVDPELLAEMRAANCTGIFYGIESPWIGETDMLKPTPREVIDRAIEQTNTAGIRCFIFVLLGLEQQDPQIAEQFLGWLAGVPATFHVSVLTPRPHTTLWKRHTDNQIAVGSWDEFAALSDTIGRQHFWTRELDSFLASVQQLPNYVVNAARGGQ